MSKAKHKLGKQIAAEHLPSRGAVASITGGSPAQRSMNNYAQETPGVDGSNPASGDFGAPGAQVPYLPNSGALGR